MMNANGPSFIRVSTQYACAVIIILIGLANILEGTAIFGLLFVAAGASLIPAVSKKIYPATYFHPIVCFVILIVVVTYNGNISEGELRRKSAEKQLEQAKLNDEFNKKSLEDFKVNPDQSLDEIRILINAKNLAAARSKIDFLKSVSNDQLHSLDEELKKLEKEKQSKDLEEAKKNAKVLEESSAARSWTVQKDQSKMDDTASITVFKHGNQSFNAWPGNDHIVTLIARCSEKKTDVILDIDTSFNVEYGEYNQAAVRYRIDDKKPSRQLWSESTDNHAAFASQPVKLLKDLRTAKLLTVQFTPFNSSPATIEIDVRGIGPHVEEIAKNCNWK